MIHDPAHPGATPAADTETDERFPSGPWTGFFLQPVLAGRHWMELLLNFRKGVVSGEGRDWVGTFHVKGRYETDSGKVWLSKQYVGRHDVAYLGFNEGRGIWGTWSMRDPAWKGGFHIWPEGMGAEGLARKAEADAPADAGGIDWEADVSLEPESIGVGAGSSEEREADDSPGAEPWRG